MKDLKFICAQPDDTYFTWQVHLWLESLKQLGHSDKAIVLIFIPSFREFNTKWKQVEDLYPESEFFYIKADDDITKKLSLYISILRPYSLMKYWQAHPEMKDKAVFYCDCDTYLTDKFNIDHLLDDDVCYLSNTNSYINSNYFDGKINDVLANKKEDYKHIDVLATATSLAGTDRETAERNKEHSGGAQYLLKNIDAEFWEKMIQDTLMIRMYLLNTNRTYFENESKGFQSWCADMWGLLWGLWAKGYETKVVPEMDFSWATDPVDKVERLGIFHNAGVVGKTQMDVPFFYKGAYHQGEDPFDDVEHLQSIIENSGKYGTHFYTSKLLKLKDIYNLKY